MAKPISRAEVIGNQHLESFFDKNYLSPLWFIKKEGITKKESTQCSRRRFLKSAAGATAIGFNAGMVLPTYSLTMNDKNILATLIKTDPWLTLDATLAHLLPDSPSPENNAPSANDINALVYLYQIMTVQPTSEDEKEFILKGVDWLNNFSQSEQGKPFVQLSVNEKETMLRGISNSRAGENWLTTLLAYLFEAMLTPPAYGGNPNGIGWQWLEHQAGFPLPKKGQRYFELPSRGRAKNSNNLANTSPVKNPLVKRTNKA